MAEIDGSFFKWPPLLVDPQEGILDPGYQEYHNTTTRRIGTFSDNMPNINSNDIGAEIPTMDEGVAPDFRLSTTSSDFQSVSTYYSLQHRQLNELQDEEGGSLGSSQPYIRTPELRVSHKLAERKRRIEIKELFDTLSARQHHERGSKASKWEILTKAISEDERKEAEIKSLCDDLRFVKKDGQRLQANYQLLQSDHQRSQADIPHLLRDKEVLQRENSTLEREIESLRLEISHLRGNGGDATRSIDAPELVPTTSQDPHGGPKKLEPNSTSSPKQNPIMKPLERTGNQASPDNRTFNTRQQCSQGINSSVELFLDNMFKQLGESFLPSPSSSLVSHGGNSSSSCYAGTPSSFSSPPYLRGKSIASKRSNEEDDERDNHPGRGFKRRIRGPNGGSRKKVDPGRRLACHLHLFDPQYYCKNSATGKRYDTCSGPGWPTVHHLKQHLGNSSGSVHKKLRCPRCRRKFKNKAAILTHLEAEGSECIDSPPPLDPDGEDDISKSAWAQIEGDTTRNDFDQLSQDVRENIDIWVSNNVIAYAPTESMESRKGELRKWYMIWRILFPTTKIPSHPFYDNHPPIAPTNAGLLIATFKETVEAGIASQEINGITNEVLRKLQEYLREAIHTVSRPIAASTERSFIDIGEDQSQDQDMLTSDPFGSQVAASAQLPSQSPVALLQDVLPSVPTPTASRQEEQAMIQNFQMVQDVATPLSINLSPQIRVETTQSSLIGSSRGPPPPFEPNAHAQSNKALESDSPNLSRNDTEGTYPINMEAPPSGIGLGPSSVNAHLEDWESPLDFQWDRALDEGSTNPVDWKFEDQFIDA